MRKKKGDQALFLLLATFWGGSFVAIKFVVQTAPPVFGALLRVGGALAILGALFKLSRKNLAVPFSLRWKMWLAGVFAQALPFCLLFWGERRVSPGLAGIINGTVPLWTFVLGLLLGVEKDFSPSKLLGLLLSFAGLAAVLRPLIAFSGSRDELLGACAIVLMAVSYAVGILLNRTLLAGNAKADFRANIYHQHCASFAVLLLASASLETWPSFGAFFSSWEAPLSILYLSLFSTAVAWLIFYHLIREWGAVSASTATYIAPVFALLWDYIFFSNVPTAAMLFGIGAILAGVVLIQRPFSKAGPA